MSYSDDYMTSNTAQSASALAAAQPNVLQGTKASFISDPAALKSYLQQSIGDKSDIRSDAAGNVYVLPKGYTPTSIADANLYKYSPDALSSLIHTTVTTMPTAATLALTDGILPMPSAANPLADFALKTLASSGYGAGAQGLTQLGINKAVGNPTTANEGNALINGATAGAMAPTLGGWTGWGTKQLANIGSTAAERELASGLSSGADKVGPNVSDLIQSVINKTSTSSIPTMQDIVNGGVDFENAPGAFENSMQMRGNTIDKLNSLKGMSPDSFADANLRASQTDNINNEATQPLYDLQNNAQNLLQNRDVLQSIGKGIGNTTSAPAASALLHALGLNTTSSVQ